MWNVEQFLMSFTFKKKKPNKQKVSLQAAEKFRIK